MKYENFRIQFAWPYILLVLVLRQNQFQGHVVCPLYGGGLFLGKSIMGGSTVPNLIFWENVMSHSKRV